MIPVEVTKISFYLPAKVMLLCCRRLVDRAEKLPVIVGSFEAQAIALAMENVETPQTDDS